MNDKQLKELAEDHVESLDGVSDGWQTTYGYEDVVNTFIAGYKANKDNAEPPVVPYQLCPKCNGQGTVSKPSYVAGDVHQWSSTPSVFPCDLCNGQKIIPMFIVPHNGIDLEKLEAKSDEVFGNETPETLRE